MQGSRSCCVRSSGVGGRCPHPGGAWQSLAGTVLCERARLCGQLHTGGVQSLLQRTVGQREGHTGFLNLCVVPMALWSPPRLPLAPLATSRAVRRVPDVRIWNSRSKPGSTPGHSVACPLTDLLSLPFSNGDDNTTYPRDCVKTCTASESGGHPLGRPTTGRACAVYRRHHVSSAQTVSLASLCS